MAKKVKCIECDNALNWAIPGVDTLRENNTLRDTLQKTIVCGTHLKQSQ